MVKRKRESCIFHKEEGFSEGEEHEVQEQMHLGWSQTETQTETQRREEKLVPFGAKTQKCKQT